MADERMRGRVWVCLPGLVVTSLVCLWPVPHARAQLSPGPLSSPHSSLDSVLRCTSCHALGIGRAELKCLDCHTEIQQRLATGRGYHARLAAPQDSLEDCAECHAEHFGRDFDIIRWPTPREDLEHEEVGYPLVGAHASVACSRCHNADNIPPAQRGSILMTDLDRSFLGLSTGCVSCHREDPHGGQFEQECASCHGFDSWSPAVTFSHDATRFPLTGLHEAVTCSGCHDAGSSSTAAPVYRGIAYASCAACHTDPHSGAFTSTCSECHRTTGWMDVSGSLAFDHSRTGFLLEAGHGALACASCHPSSDFSRPVAHERCLDCHEDYHLGQFSERADGGDCESCHDVTSFHANSFTSARHGESRYPLVGMHQEVQCSGCHEPTGAARDYHPSSALCVDCHSDSHQGQFGDNPQHADCAACHSENGFAPSTFTIARHGEGSFPLTGAHVAVLCFDCHTPLAEPGPEPETGLRFVFEDRSCASCHADPHELSASADARIAECESCHRAESWSAVETFDHSITRFDMGAHEGLECAGCHTLEGGTPSGIVFGDAPLECAGCHADPHGGQFDPARQTPPTCSNCHTDADWSALAFDHDRNSDFHLDGAHAEVPCALCHLTGVSPEGETIRVYAGTPRECAECH